MPDGNFSILFRVSSGMPNQSASRSSLASGSVTGIRMVDIGFGLVLSGALVHNGRGFFFGVPPPSIGLFLC